MSDDRAVKIVFLGKPDRRRKARRPKLRWLDCFENDLKWMGVKRWVDESRRQVCMGYHSEGAVVNCKDLVPMKKKNRKKKKKKKL
jgi:hypothetical protein